MRRPFWLRRRRGRFNANDIDANSMVIAPTFGIANITSFAYSASASDPDNDALSYAWSLAGDAATGSAGQVIFVNGFSSTADLTVSDGKGGSVSDSRPFTVGSMSGNWTGSNSALTPASRFG